ncbi:UDP-4-amino-4,6-dideoxy-N-acetyl-beta-L-altrosamine transaminase [Bacillus sp. AGMB 02131]|uniref:UDP-4-amino-4, 6-dideoxy-N-acetyl-beta-L-altrosamine transaminase n=1 Tax=Peribacillus faecalis TaxID=2772559 RepID=A0A927D1C0_9BACI|nr:UDP-4-amino-4,6-dideoxy-N-acetyl-beta-L-altrosamine transaminase [Peribacillus faecalis]MBD3109665.1 UDP-4-amino-4,6-dideoxy-N-acetyl-beta-L-altrosamine transaminase [Peribacillus faecalis]
MMGEELAINGGKPVRETYLPYGRQAIDDEDIEAVIKVLKSDYLTTGPVIRVFERDMAEATGAKYAVAFSNGTAALHAACYAAGITEGDEVITTPMTFAATSNSVLYQRGRPVFADIDPQTYNIDPKSIKQLITGKTKAIVPVHFTGQPAEMDAIMQIADEHKLVVIEDAAHALGALYKNRKIGSIGDMTMFSFHPVKHITTGEGGLITTNNQGYYEKLLQFRTHGITREPSALIENQGPWYYEMQFLGFNYRITDIQAALGVTQLQKLHVFIEQRKQLVQYYREQLSDIDELVLPQIIPHVDSSWHLFIVKLKLDRLSAGRKTIFEALQKENIGVNVHYLPVHLHPYYQQLGYEKGSCPIAESCYEQFVTLPLFPSMTKSDAADVVTALKKVVHYYRSQRRE